MARIAAFSDPFDQIESLCRALADHGHDVVPMVPGRTGIQQLRDGDFQLVLFLWASDDLGTASNFAALRRDTQLPIFCLTGSNDEALTIAALRGGADACISLPISPIELNARVQAQLRRFAIWTQTQAAEQNAQPLGIDEDAVVVEGRAIELSSVERRLLERLQSQSGAVVSRDELCDHVWGTDAKERYTNLSLVVYNLRKKLERNPHHPRYLLTKWGVGYYLSPDFRRHG